MNLKKVIPIVSSVFLCLLVGYVSGNITAEAIPGWYRGLNKPSFNPPDWLFAPVWTTLFILMGWAAGRIWNQGIHKKEVRNALYLYAAQLTLNFLWSIFFFGLKNPALALADIMLLILFIIWTLFSFRKLDRAAEWFLYPYLLWVLFAGILNTAIVRLN